MDDLPDRPYTYMSHERVVLRQQLFGFTSEEVNLLVKPMALSGAEALGSMGTDTPIAVLSARPRMLFDYFSQLFAQVTNPPLDAIREEVVTSLGAHHRPRGRPAAPERGVLQADLRSRSRSCTTTTCRSSFTSTTTANSRASAASSIRGLYPVQGRRRRYPSCARRHQATRCRRQSRVAHASSCSRTASPPRTTRRSRRCS